MTQLSSLSKPVVEPNSFHEMASQVLLFHEMPKYLAPDKDGLEKMLPILHSYTLLGRVMIIAVQ